MSPQTDVLSRDTNSVNSRRRNNTKCDPFEVVSNVRVNLRLFVSGGPLLTMHITEGGLRWIDQGGVARVLSVMSEEGLKPDKRTLDHLSKIAGDWLGMVKGVVGGACDEEGVANNNRGVAVVPDAKCLESAIHLQLRLGNGRAVEVLRRFGEEAGILSGSARYRLLALGCRTQHDSHSLLTQMKKEGVTPDTHTVGVLLRDAAGRLDYECLTALMKEMRHSRLEPDKSILRILAKVADGRVPKSPRMKLRFNGFKGYYTLWKKHYPQLESQKHSICHVTSHVVFWGAADTRTQRKLSAEESRTRAIGKRDAAQDEASRRGAIASREQPSRDTNYFGLVLRQRIYRFSAAFVYAELYTGGHGEKEKERERRMGKAWLYWRVMVVDMVTWSPLFLIMTLVSTYLISEAYRKIKISLKHRISLRREVAVSKEVLGDIAASGKKLNKAEKDERISWKKNEVADTEATTFSIFYNNALFLFLVLAFLYFMRSFPPLVNYMVATGGAGILLLLLSTGSNN
ncbi:Translocon-associated protein subunit gamma [Geodia barretti]|uniref:Translocon-associated protein subunit gamma n=1 Tax=Geodia barretti TaxID=519541 RepID=A0AA35TCB0_GEOBA|nr:Translocon-associated protein subunit gamma [Geodia barretti]